MDDYNQFEMTSVDGGGSGCALSGCLSFILASILVFGGIGFIISLFQS